MKTIVQRRKRSDAIYPWDEWFSRPGVLRLERYRDYQCQDHGMVQQIRNAARDRGILVHVRTREGRVEAAIGSKRRNGR